MATPEDIEEFYAAMDEMYDELAPEPIIVSMRTGEERR